MKTRRGSSLWPSTLSGAAMVNQYKPGDIVTSSLVRQSDFIGVVRGVDPKINKVWVAWAGGVVCQHDPDEIHFEPHQSETVKSRMASRRPFAADPGLVSKAKKDAASRLAKAGIKYQSLSAKTVGFGGFGYGDSVFVTINGADFPAGWKEKVFGDVPKPSAGGYVISAGKNCFVTVDGKRHQIVASEEKSDSRRPFADRTAATHQEISKSVHPSRPCKAGDLFHSGRGLQCGNCGAYTEDHGKTWEMAPEGKSRRSAADPVTDPQFVGDPAAHGMDKPIGGGFSIMQNLVKDQRQEMHEESKGGNPKMATLRSRRAMEFPTQDAYDKYLKEHPEADKSLHRVVESKPKYQIHEAKHDIGNKTLNLTSHTYSDDGSFFLNLNTTEGLAVDPSISQIMFDKKNKDRVHDMIRKHLGTQDFSVESVRKDPVESKKKVDALVEELKGLDTRKKDASLRSRRAMYWSNPDRIYRLTKREIVDSSALCPRCRVEMSLEPYTKNDRMYCCSQCKFKIPKSNVIVASLKSRRSAVSAS